MAATRRLVLIRLARGLIAIALIFGGSLLTMIPIHALGGRVLTDSDHAYPLGHRVEELPEGSLPVLVGKERYYYADGVFYLGDDSGYIVVRAPEGAEVGLSTDDMIVIDHGAKAYAFYNGVFYTRAPGRGRYSVAVPPVGIVVPSLPESNSVILRDGILYHVYAGLYYREMLHFGVPEYRLEGICGS